MTGVRRVALVSPYSLSVPGGVQGQVLGLARALRARGIETRVVGPTDGPPPEPGVVSVGPSTRFATNGSIAPIAVGKPVARRTLEAVRAFRPDVIHLHEPFVPGPAHAVILSPSAPIVSTFHAFGDLAWYERLRKLVDRYSRRFAYSTAVSEDAARLARRYLPDLTIEIVPNGVDVAAIAGAEPWPSHRPAVLFIGRHEERKGLGVLLEAWDGIGRDAVLWVAGEGPQTAALHARGVAAVDWLGRIPEADKARRLRGASAFCAPALGGESFGVVLLEAMAAGTPVVASDIDGYRHVVRPGREALLVPPRDAEALRAALRAVLAGGPEVAARVAAGRARADEFSMAALARRYEAIYAAAAARAATPA